MNMLTYALHALELGLCVMPASEDGKKQPLGISLQDRRWKQYQNQLPTEKKIREWYATGINNIGFITGAISGNLEVIDFDDADAYHEFKGAAADSGLADIIERIESGYLEHSPKGVHWYYYCAEISGNSKLASRLKEPHERKDDRDKVQVMIETRGEGGFIIAAPSRGAVNNNGEYRVVRGSLDNIVTISPEERREIFHLAYAFDKMPKTVEKADIHNDPPATEGRPGDAFKESTSWDDILTPHGWRRCFSRGDETFWTRPGKKFGISATTNYQGSGLFYCFSSSTEFEPNRGFSKFAVYTYLNHQGNFSYAAGELAQDGYGEQDYVKPEEETRVLKFKEIKPEDDPMVIPPFLMDVPGIVNDVKEWLVSTAVRKQPILAFAASLALAGLLMGRKVQTSSRLRTNLLIIGLGDSACGKDSNRKGIKQILVESGHPDLIGSENIGSESGLLDELHKLGGRAIFQLDEIGHMLRSMTNKRANNYLAAVIPTLMKLQSTAGGMWIGKALAADKKTGLQQRKDIEDPCVVVYGTSVPGKYYDSIDYSNIEDGFLPRFLVFESDDPFPLINRNQVYGRVPEYIINHVEAWENDNYQQGISNPLHKNAVNEVRTVHHTTETMDIMTKFEKKVQAEYRAERKEKCHAVWGRSQAMAEQLALLFTCSANPQAVKIDVTSCHKAAGLAYVLCKQQVLRIKRNVSDGDHEQDVKQVLRIVNDAGLKGIAKSDLIRRSQRIPAKRLSDIIMMLIESDQIIPQKVPTNRRPKTLFFGASFVVSDE